MEGQITPGAGFRERSWLTLGTILLLALVFGLQHLETDFLARAFGEIKLLRLGANAPALVEVGEWFRLVTGNFLHRDLRHLALNSSVILLLGATLEPILGRKRLFLLMFLGSVAGTLGSVVFTQPALSIGASTTAFALAGGVAFLWVVRWDELPKGSWLGGLVAGFLVAGELLEFRAPANVDRGAHRAALVAGFAILVLLTMWKHVSELVEHRPRWLNIASAAAGLLVCLAVGQGVWYFWSDGDRSVQIWAEARLRRLDVSPFEINNRAQFLAGAEQPSRSALQLAERRMQRVTRTYPFLHPFWDTLANLQFRGGEYAQAIASERNAIAIARRGALSARSDEAAISLYVENLANMAESQLECCGTLRLGRASRFQPRFGLEATRLGEAGRRALVLNLGSVYPASLTIHALAIHEGRPLGYVEVELLRARTSTYRFAKGDAAHNAYPPDVRFEIVLVDTSRGPRARNLIRLWTFRTDRPLMKGLKPIS